MRYSSWHQHRRVELSGDRTKPHLRPIRVVGESLLPPPPLRFGWNGEKEGEGGQREANNTDGFIIYIVEQYPRQTLKDNCLVVRFIFIRFKADLIRLLNTTPHSYRSPLETKGWGRGSTDVELNRRVGQRI